MVHNKPPYQDPHCLPFCQTEFPLFASTDMSIFKDERVHFRNPSDIRAWQRFGSACAVAKIRSESSLGTFWIAKDVKFPSANNEAPDMTADVQADKSLCFLTLWLIYNTFLSLQSYHNGEKMYKRLIQCMLNKKNPSELVFTELLNVCMTQF